MRGQFHRLGQHWLDLFFQRLGQITWAGLAIVFYVALDMIWTGMHQVGCRFVDKAACDSGTITTLSTLLFS